MRLHRPLLFSGLLLSPFALIAQPGPQPQIPALPAPESQPGNVSPATPTAVPAPAAPAEEMITELRLPDAPLELVLDRLATMTNRVILRPQALPTAAVTLNISKPITKSEAILAIKSVLNLNNIAVIEMGDRFLQVVELNRSRTQTPTLLQGSTLSLPPSGTVASKIFELSYLRATEFVPQLNGLLNAQLGGGLFFTNTNAFMVTDSIANLQRVEILIEELDHPATMNFKPQFFTLNNAKPSDITTRIQSLIQGPIQSQIGNNFTLSADDRSNQIVLIADERQGPFFKDLIEKLDTKAEDNTSNEVIRLNNATAVDVASRLTELISGQAASAARVGAQTAARRTAAGATIVPGGGQAQNVQPQQAQGGNQGGNQGNQGGNNNQGGNQQQRANAIAAAITSASAGATSQFSGVISVTSDERLNAIIVSGTKDDIRLIKELVAKLDRLLPQVRIEVVVAEVSLTNADSSGIDSLGLRVIDGKLTGFTAAASGAGLGITGVASGTTTSSFAELGSNYSLSGLINLTTTPRKSNAIILSTPTIVTSHNKEARIFVGERRPVISGYQNTNTNAATGGFNSTVSQQEIGITLTVTPLIGEDGSVQLTIEQDVADVSGSVTIDGNEQPIVSSRQTQSFVSVGSGEIIVLGGLQRKATTGSTSRLGPIPLIGDLLGKRAKSTTRTDLIFFLRPIVLTNTSSDNESALKRLDAMSQGKDVRRLLDPTLPPPPEEKPPVGLRRPK